MKESNPNLHSQRVSDSLVGKIGVNARRWKGSKASYVAKHMWIYKHYGKASHCENNSSHKSVRFEWANISGKYLRDVTDYKQLCKKCHVELDRKQVCKNGHLKIASNVYISTTGWYSCRICRREYQRKYVAKNNKV